MKVLERFSQFVVQCGTRLIALSTIFALVITGCVPAFAKTTTLQDRTYHFSVFAAQSATALASCSANNCKTSTMALETGGNNGDALFCDQPTCTFYAHVESDTQVSAGDTGLFTFVLTDLNDQVMPLTPGPTNPDGSVAFLAKEPDAATHYGASASVLTTVPGGWYVLRVNIGCLDAGSGGCSALSFHSTLSVDIYSN